MKNLNKIFILPFLVFVLSSCELLLGPKETLPEFENIVITDIKPTSAHISSMPVLVGSAAISDVGIIYSTKKDISTNDKKLSLGSKIELNQKLEGVIQDLLPGTEYYVAVYATLSSNKLQLSKINSFKTTSVQAPKVSISEASDIKTNTFTIGGQISELGTSDVTEHGHALSETNKEPTTADLITKMGASKSVPKDFKSVYTGLKANTSYYVRSYATNATGTAYSSVKTVQTGAIASAKVTTKSIDEIQATSVNVSGNVSDQGTFSITDYGHVLSKNNQNPTTADTKTSFGALTNIPKDFFSTFKNLEANTIYYTRTYAITDAGTAYGETKSFKTLNVQAPNITTVSATTGALGGTWVDLVGKINSLGGSPNSSDYGFCYSSSNQSPTISDIKLGLGSTTDGNLTFKGNVPKLANGTYYVRAYATNAVGTGYGESKTFIIKELPNVIISVPFLFEKAKVSNLTNDKYCTNWYPARSGVFVEDCNYAPEDKPINVVVNYKKGTEGITKIGICAKPANQSGDPTNANVVLETTNISGSFTAKFNKLTATGVTRTVSCPGFLGPSYNVIVKQYRYDGYLTVYSKNGVESLEYKYRPYAVTNTGKVIYGETVTFDAGVNCNGPGER